MKDITTANIQNIRTEEIELIDEEDTPPPVPDTPRRLQYDRTPAIPEEDSTSGKDNKFRRKLRDGFVQMTVITNPAMKKKPCIEYTSLSNYENMFIFFQLQCNTA